MISFGTMVRAKHREDGGEIPILVDGKQVGEICAELEHTGSIILRRWRASAYRVELWERDGKDHTFRIEHGETAASVLSKAKNYVRAVYREETT